MERHPPPDPESLRCFLAAARHLNFRTAAGEVALSPAAFSDRIKRLEELLGARLFARTTRKVALTSAGRRLVPTAEAALDAGRACHRAVAGPDRPLPFALTLGTRFELGLSWLVPALGPLAEDRPERALNLYFGDTPDLLLRLRRGDLDALVTSARLTEAALAFAPLHEEAYVFCAAPAAVAARALRGPADAAHHALLDTLPDLPLFRYFRDARPAAEAWRFARVEHLGTIAAVRARLLDGAGVAVLPHYFVAPDLARGELVTLCPGTTLPTDFFRLWWREGHPLADELGALAAALRARPLR